MQSITDSTLHDLDEFLAATLNRFSANWNSVGKRRNVSSAMPRATDAAQGSAWRLTHLKGATEAC